MAHWLTPIKEERNVVRRKHASDHLGVRRQIAGHHRDLTESTPATHKTSNLPGRDKDFSFRVRTHHKPDGFVESLATRANVNVRLAIGPVLLQMLKNRIVRKAMPGCVALEPFDISLDFVVIRKHLPSSF